MGAPRQPGAARTAVDAARAVCGLLGPCLAYPGPGLAAALDRTVAAARGPHPEAARGVEAFLTDAGAGEGLSARLAPVYTRTFDLAPVCAPFLSVHLFGEESFKRARLMTGLDESYARAGFDRGGELPDHVSLVLGFAPRFEEAEWRELRALVLAPALARMHALLARAGSPYRHLVGAAQALTAEEVSHG